ncbi:hypothetical protein [Modestobacter sp. SSW1-42]|uniref:hypothetical protein n=1 Tax=Modestobacter sp. SSW1-42 TaxID=596372 RepID=UPI0039872C94
MTSTATQTTFDDSAITVVVNQLAPQAPVRRRRRVAAIALAVGGATMLSTGAFAAWETTASAQSGALSAASGSAALLDANGGTFTFSGVSNLVPKDFFYRYVDVRNDGTGPNTFTGTVAAGGDLVGHIAVEATTCTGAWVPATGVCAGTVSAPIGSGTPTAAAPVTVNHGVIATGATAVQHVRYKFTFAEGAPATLQGKNGSLTISVNNTLVGGNDRTLS